MKNFDYNLNILEMKKKTLAVILALTIVVFLCAQWCRADSKSSREYQIKAAFIYNFMKFVDWPKERVCDINEPMVIGIVGKNPFGNAFDAISKKKVNNKKINVKYFSNFDGIDSKDILKQCHILYVCLSEKKNLEKVAKIAKNRGILTIADINGFAEAGGIIGFVKEKGKIRFEINLAVAEKSKLKIRSSLLKLAKRVIKDK